MPTPSTPAATGAIVGPSLVTILQNDGPPGRTMTRPTGMPLTRIGANSPRRGGGGRLGGGGRSSLGPRGSPSGGRARVVWTAGTAAASAEPARAVIHELLLFSNGFEQRLRDIVMVRERPPVSHDDDEGLERLAVLLGKILLKIEVRVRVHRRADV